MPGIRNLYTGSYQRLDGSKLEGPSVAEQHEEEALFKGILDKIEMIGTEGKGLFFIDQVIGKLTTGAPAGGDTGASDAP